MNNTQADSIIYRLKLTQQILVTSIGFQYEYTCIKIYMHSLRILVCIRVQGEQGFLTNIHTPTFPNSKINPKGQTCTRVQRWDPLLHFYMQVTLDL